MSFLSGSPTCVHGPEFRQRVLKTNKVIYFLRMLSHHFVQERGNIPVVEMAYTIKRKCPEIGYCIV